ncbi:hypothetical protein CAI21_14540 [Alkalilimnicola ehrlichii]|uniref:Uncharacterized protein n=1 Tax=Alkalilimnicola ehrlichii TaxID=351052 RepID=A0A3E0WN36_9GAMM|nr:hypothetical protein [Alkalilimnicola ehrlichii]RFA27260.1 hypothetical protein CAI21_14540 [Alkalilimnicola ehrlichii]RFA34372.1 hypothetical protein CAL65_15110 [Alkalilimnicola ehrlichii]
MGQIRFLTFLLGLFFTAGAAATGFRGFEWGTTEDEILEEMGEPLQRRGDCLIYQDRIIERQVRVLYCLDDGNALYRGAYVFQDTHPMPYNKHVEDYEQLLPMLSERHGEATRNEVIWRLPALRINKPYWGHRIASRDLELRATWAPPATQVEMVLQGGDFNKITHYIEYKSLESMEQRRQQDRELL